MVNKITIKPKLPEYYLEYPHHIDNKPIWEYKYPFDIKIQFSFKEKLKLWFGKHNPRKYECWAIDRFGNRYLVEVDLIKNVAIYKGKKW